MTSSVLILVVMEYGLRPFNAGPLMGTTTIKVVKSHEPQPRGKRVRKEKTPTVEELLTAYVCDSSAYDKEFRHKVARLLKNKGFAAAHILYFLQSNPSPMLVRTYCDYYGINPRRAEVVIDILKNWQEK